MIVSAEALLIPSALQHSARMWAGLWWANCLKITQK